VKENSIEEDIKNAEHFIKSIKTDKEYKEDGWHGYYNKEIVELARILQHILSDYKRVLKENEELKECKKIAELTKISCCTAQNCEALNNAIKSELENQKLKEELNDINQKWIQKVKDKIEEYKNMLKTCNKAKDIARIIKKQAIPNIKEYVDNN
jgi:hypothetical protein